MKKLLIIFFFLLILTPLVFAQPPQATQVVINLETGLGIDTPSIPLLKANESFSFSFHIFNISNGVGIDNATTNCSFELYNKSGQHIFELDLIPYSDGDWEVFIKGGNFSELGLYAYIVECDDGNIGGFDSSNLEISRLGTSLQIGESIFYIALIFAILILFTIFLIIFIKTPFENEKEMTKEGLAIVKVTISKYVKLISLWIAFGFFLWFISIISGMAQNYIFFIEVKRMIGNLSVYLNILGWIFNRIMPLVLLVLTWKDILFNRTILKEGKALLKRKW